MVEDPGFETKYLRAFSKGISCPGTENSPLVDTPDVDK
jgi:hypothetical protein